MFTALRHRDFALYWLGGLVSFTGSWVQSVCYSWLVYDITGSKFWLGLIGLISGIPLLFTFFSGPLVDRLDKKRTLMVTQALFAAFALILGILVSHGVIAKGNYAARYYILAVAFLQGIVLSIDQPIRQSMPSNLVPKKHLGNAIALTSASFNGARIIGPTLGALIMGGWGAAACFYANSVSFLAVIAAMLFMNIELPAKGRGESSVLADLIEGFTYIFREPQILKLMVFATVLSFFVMPYMTFIPVFAKDILKAGVKGNGMLFTSVGVGALAGALLLAKTSDMPKRGRMLLISSALGSVLMIAFANSKEFWISQLMLIGLGFMVVSFSQTTNSLIQYTTSDEFRGRVMSLYVFVFMGLGVVANFQAGALAEKFGAPMAVTIWGFIFMALAVYIATQKDILNL